MTRLGPLRSISLRLALVALSLAIQPASLRAQSAPDPTPSLDPAVAAALHQSTSLQQHGELSSALDNAQKALKLAKNNCAPCQRQIGQILIGMDRPHDAAAAAAAWASHAATPAEKAAAEYLQARALVLEDRQKFLADQKHKDSLLQHADQLLHQAATEDPYNPDIHLLDGHVLATLKRDADARSQFLACAADPHATPLQCRRAKAFAQDISLATSDEAPSFTITRPDGGTVSLDSLAGKVVLVDFWATWCGPCARDLDYIQSIAEEFNKENFVLLGISTDEDEAAWKNHVHDNRMIGLQVRDHDHQLKDLFGVGGIPTYLVLDGNGVVRLRITGTRGDIRGKVRDLLKASSSPPSTNPAIGN
jgi:peroxiredoxin